MPRRAFLQWACIAFTIVVLLVVASFFWWQSDARACPIPDDGDPSTSVVDPQECRLLRHLPNIAWREGNQLVVSLAGGTTRVSFNDNLEDNDSWLAHRLVGYAPKSDVIEIVIGYYEASAALLVDRATGQELDIDYAPHRSPDERSWAIVKTDYLNGDMNVQVAALTSAGLVLLANHVETAGEDCDFLAWDSTQSFRIVCSDLNGTIQEQIVSMDSAGKWTVTAKGKLWSPEAFERLRLIEQ
jgi:hypothetical protein